MDFKCQKLALGGLLGRGPFIFWAFFRPLALNSQSRRHKFWNFIFDYGLGAKYTVGSRPSGSFFTQVDHLFSANSFSKQVINLADFFTLKISEPSDHWLKSYGQKVNFQSTKS